MEILKNIKRELAEVKRNQKDLMDKFSGFQHTESDVGKNFVLVTIDNVEDLRKLET